MGYRHSLSLVFSLSNYPLSYSPAVDADSNSLLRDSWVAPEATDLGFHQDSVPGSGDFQDKRGAFSQTPGKLALRVTPSHFLIFFGISLPAELDLGSPMVRRGKRFPGRSKRPLGVLLVGIPELGSGVAGGDRKYTNLCCRGIIKQDGGELKVEPRR